jgi:hypothetical protein
MSAPNEMFEDILTCTIPFLLHHEGIILTQVCFLGLLTFYIVQPFSCAASSDPSSW